MGLLRRHFLSMAAGAAAFPALPWIARAADYPTRAVHLIVGFPAGSGPDIIARLAAQSVSTRIGQEVVVDNRPGAGGNIGTEVAAKAAPDGYTIFQAVSANAINVSLYKNLNFDFANDLVPIGMIALTPFVIVVNPSFAAKNLSELIALAKEKPGAINMATSGVGSGSHVSGELFQMMAGIKLTHVPYRNNYVPDLLAGQVPLAVSPLPQVSEFIKDGRLRGLGVTPATRSQLLPGVPSIGEVVKGYDATGWFGLCAPRGTSPDIISKLNAAITAGIADPKIRERLVAVGSEPRAMTADEFGKFIASEIAKWRKVIEFAAIKVQ
ncbi:MAG TPA: tripartite tricarboxylate transporter substrate binding protein [Xanthobacteraceae bacterium]|nr:tripartite tricarboxylate transporter substrate binding protein [Xanthobacteraceae bacterium]